MTELRLRLLQAQWQKHRDATIVCGDGDTYPVVIRRPPLMTIIEVLQAAQIAGELDADKKPIDEVAGLRFMARIAITTIFTHGAIRPLFSLEDLEEVQRAPWLLDVQQDIMGAVAHAGVAVEAAKGNSRATQT
jgi:hypothetical protein